MRTPLRHRPLDAKPLSIADRMQGRGARLYAAMAFLVVVFLLGGGSRSDVLSLILLRPLAVLFGAYAIWAMPAGRGAALRAPILWIAILGLWMVVQLVPLPPEWWSTLPARMPIHRIDAMLGQSDLWRPLSLMPSMTWNSLMSLLVPASAFLVFAAVDPGDRRTLVTTLIWLGVASAIIGLMQVSTGRAEVLYFYRITNNDSMVGLFSNRNHHAIFLSSILVLIGFALRTALKEKDRRPLLLIGLAGATLLVLVVLLGIGSRAGLVTGVVAIAVYAAMVWPILLKPDAFVPGQKRPKGALRSNRTRIAVLVVLPAVLLVSIFALFFASTQINALSRSVGEGYSEDVRGQTLPIIIDMVQSHWLLGSGFGSFAGAYRIVEPDRLLQAEFFNHAHNDWAQLVIEGGLPMILLVLAAIVWIAARTMSVWRGYRFSRNGQFAALPGAAGAVCLIVAVASLVDYPLRTPSIMVMFALMIVLLGRSDEPVATDRGRA